MSIVLFDNAERSRLYPLNNVCAVADIRLGIFTMRERWELISNDIVFIHPANYLSILYQSAGVGTHLWIDAGVMADDNLINQILSLKENQAIIDSKGLIAGRKNFGNDAFSPSKSP